MIPLLPLIAILAAAILTLIIPLWSSRRQAPLSALLGFAGLGATVAVAWWLWRRGDHPSLSMVASDRIALWTDIVLAVGGLLTLGLCLHPAGRKNLPVPELVAMILFSTAGMMIVGASTDLFLSFLGLEILSLAAYVLAGLDRMRLVSNEAALKYFALGAFASAFFLFGVALYYGAVGTTSLLALSTTPSSAALLTLSSALLLVGLAFKGAWVPFHLWTPDVYQGAPTPVTAFMAGSIKVAAFILAVRLLTGETPLAGGRVTELLAVASALTMIVGNLGALFQQNIKRLLAYSAIAHAGYALIGLAVGNLPSLLFYLVSYLFMTLGSFGVVVAMDKRGDEPSDLNDFSGLGSRHPALAAAMAIFMFALTGLPPTIGFAGKFYLFQAAVENGFVWLAVVGVVGSLVSVAYYFRVIWIMYFGEGVADYQPPPIPHNVTAVLAVSVFTVLILGILPGPLIAFARQTVGLP